jgi:two-component system LytT family response regulator
VTIDVLVVDDEPLARARLRRLIEEEPDLRLIGECANGEEAIAAIREGEPRLVFLDVDMPDMTGFDVLEAVPPVRRPAVVFVTAYDEFAVRAFEVHALDYLLKPFDAPRFAATLARVRAQVAAPRDPALAPLAALLEEVRARQHSLERSMRGPAATWPERLVVRAGRELVFVRVRDVDWFSSADNYVELHLGRTAHLLRETLSGVERRLDPEHFVRIRRDAIVNLDRVRSVRAGATGDPEIVLQDGKTLRLGRAYRARVTERWQGHRPRGADPAR